MGLCIGEVSAAARRRRPLPGGSLGRGGGGGGDADRGARAGPRRARALRPVLGAPGEALEPPRRPSLRSLRRACGARAPPEPAGRAARVPRWRQGPGWGSRPPAGPAPRAGPSSGGLPTASGPGGGGLQGRRGAREDGRGDLGWVRSEPEAHDPGFMYCPPTSITLASCDQ